MTDYISVEQVQERLSLSRDTVDRMIRRGEIQAVKIGRCVRISEEEIERYLQSHKFKTPEAESL
jgi:excisionase family DNA binding protein